jgi:hypothetical protein
MVQAVILFALAAALTVGGALGYALKTSSTLVTTRTITVSVPAPPTSDQKAAADSASGRLARSNSEQGGAASIPATGPAASQPGSSDLKHDGSRR